MHLRLALLLGCTGLLLGGCATLGGGDEGGASQTLRLGAYTFQVPADALVGTVYFPTSNHLHELPPVHQWRGGVVYPHALQICMPGGRGSMVIYDPDTAGYRADLFDGALELSWLLQGCGWNTEINGIPCVELDHAEPNAHYYRTVWVNRQCRASTADLVIHYDGAFLKDRKYFDAIIASVSR